VSEFAGATPWGKVEGGLLFSSGTNLRVRGSYRWQAGTGGWWLGLDEAGMGDLGAAGGDWGLNVHHGGWRAFWSRGCREDIVRHIHGFLPIRGGVR